MRARGKRRVEERERVSGLRLAQLHISAHYFTLAALLIASASRQFMLFGQQTYLAPTAADAIAWIGEWEREGEWEWDWVWVTNGASVRPQIKQ